jgi:hypothetical protein
MGHFSVVFVKIKIFDGPFNFCMCHLHRITAKLYDVSNGPWPLPEMLAMLVANGVKFPFSIASPVSCSEFSTMGVVVVSACERQGPWAV